MNDKNKILNPEDRAQCYVWGEQKERDFVEDIVPRLGIDLRINPQKAQRQWEIDLFDYTHNRYADLKTQTTPFRTAGNYRYGEAPYNPDYTVTFNKKDYENYLKNHSDCDIYFWIHWTHPASVWRASFQKMAEKIQSGEAALHAYIHRVNDDHNAKESYLFDLKDNYVFERLL